ncbi:MAG: alpha/beta hydrolase [bacterium]|nr:alpha/beta hydrolase [bacterium]
MTIRRRRNGAAALALVVLGACVRHSAPPLTADDLPALPAGYPTGREASDAIRSGAHEMVGPHLAVVPEGVTVDRDVEYGRADGIPLLLDLYRPVPTGRRAPALIFIHGGAWEEKGKGFYRYWALHYAARGYVCASIEYRVSSERPFPAAVEDAKCAVRWMRANARTHGINPNRIGVVGQSAGAHLAMMVAYASEAPALEGRGGHEGVSSAVQVVVDYYGPTDLTRPGMRNHGAVRRFLGGVPYEDDRGLYRRASPLSYVDRDAPPTLVFHGTVDAIVPVEQADLLVARLTELGVPCVYDCQEGWPHAMDLVLDINRRCVYIMDWFLDEHLPVERRGRRTEGGAAR